MKIITIASKSINTHRGSMQEVLSILILVCDMKVYNTVLQKYPSLEVFCCHSNTSAESVCLASVNSFFQKCSCILWKLTSIAGCASLRRFLILWHWHPSGGGGGVSCAGCSNYSNFRTCYGQHSRFGFFPQCIFYLLIFFINKIQEVSIP